MRSRGFTRWNKLKYTFSFLIAQRSAQELPLVEKQSLDSYPATGGTMMLLSGLNFLPDSKVVFVEKAQGKLRRPASRFFSAFLSLAFPQCLLPSK